MDKEFTRYVDKVVENIGISGRKEREIREDIYASLVEKQSNTGEDDPYILMGDPKEVADEFRENLDINKGHDYYIGYRHLYRYEYISKTKIFGIPLVHINYKRFGTAKGIIAIGNIAIGILAIGGLSVGVLSLGGLAAGLLLAFGGGAFGGACALGGLAASAGISFGGIAMAGYCAIGGIAMAKHCAFGGLAIGNIAIGGTAKGIISVYKESGSGKYLFQAPVNVDDVIKSIKIVYPLTGEKSLKFIKYIIQYL